MKPILACILLLLSTRLRSILCEDEADHKCSHCLATSEVLAKRIASEKPRNHLDFRGRLDGQGTRYGKILDFRLSELRIIELLDDLSSEFNSYVQIESEEGMRWQHENSRSGNVTTVDELEKQHWKRQVKRWCEQAIERHEDAITRYLQSEAVSEGGIQDLLCGKLTQACPIAVSKEEL